MFYPVACQLHYNLNFMENYSVMCLYKKNFLRLFMSKNQGGGEILSNRMGTIVFLKNYIQKIRKRYVTLCGHLSFYFVRYQNKKEKR